jgi:outer membrane protein OmpA-like peptidoglycan-associated protein
VIFFFIFSAGHLTRKREAVSPPPPAAVPAKPSSPVPQPSEPVVARDPQSPVPAGIPRTEYFTTPEALLADLANRLASGKADRVSELTGDSPRTAFLLELLRTNKVSPDSTEIWSDVGVMSGVSRYQLAAASSTLKPGSVSIDIERTKSEGWKVKALRFDPLLVKDTALATPPDALDQARRFLDGVLSHDFKAARTLTDQVKVTHERLAGMCIVFEEGDYRIAPKRPVVVTAGTEDTAWAIVKIRSEKDNLDSEIGLEMERTAAGDWTIHTLDFNKMLEGHVKATNTGNVFYSPIVKSAKGGESIVLYFEFDKAELHPRALHQLDIIASLLKSDPARKMRITGHSDALGTDDYNVRLSAARAKNVRARLLELGVADTQIETTGVGSKAPLDPDRRADGSDNPEGRSRNRRTEIYLDF